MLTSSCRRGLRGSCRTATWELDANKIDKCEQFLCDHHFQLNIVGPDDFLKREGVPRKPFEGYTFDRLAPGDPRRCAHCVDEKWAEAVRNNLFK